MSHLFGKSAMCEWMNEWTNDNIYKYLTQKEGIYS
jgi:hypothetical protein